VDFQIVKIILIICFLGIFGEVNSAPKTVYVKLGIVAEKLVSEEIILRRMEAVNIVKNK